MTTVAATAHTEEKGVLYVRKVCNEANQVFREVTARDVGIDGFLEVCEDGAPAGKLIGFQIKSGDGFLTQDERAVVFRADKPHFAYWARCHFPVIGVVYVPKLEVAVWVDLSALATNERIVHGPFSERIAATPGNCLTADTLLALIITRAYAVEEGVNVTSNRRPRPLTVQESRHLVEQGLPSGHDELEGDEAWSQSIDVLLSMTSPDDLVAQMAQSLLFYYPAAEDDWPGEQLRRRVRGATDAQIAKLVRAANAAMIDDADHVAEAVASLFEFIPSPRGRLRRLIERGLIPHDVVWAAEQIVDFLEQ